MAVFSRIKRPTFTASTQLTKEIAQALACSPRHIKLLNLKDFSSGHRFLYFQTKQGFGKLASLDVAKRQLVKEERNTLWAEQVGLRTAKVLASFRETSRGDALLLFERLPSKPGSFIHDLPTLSCISRFSARQYARLAVDTIMRSSYRPVKEFDPTRFPMQEMAQAPKYMLSKIQQWNKMYQNPNTYQNLITAMPELASVLEQAVSQLGELEGLIPELIERWGTTDQPHFVHNDAYIKNMYFRRSWSGFKEAILIDFEYSTATHYPVLGLMKDLADLYGCVGYNPYLQEQLIRSAFKHRLEHLPHAGNSEPMRLLLKGAILLGTLTFTQYALSRAQKSKQNFVEALRNDPIFDLFKLLLTKLPEQILYLNRLSGGIEEELFTLASTQYVTSEVAQ